MKKIVLAASAAFLTTPDAVLAADVMDGRSPYLNAPPPALAYNWIGPYAGLNLGYEWASATGSGANPGGFAGGAQAGYNWQSGEFVLGLETDLQASGAGDRFANWKFSNPWFGTLRGRAGYAMNNVLLYGTLGIAYGGGRLEHAFLTDSNTHFGWAGGLGIEIGLTPSLSARAEYLFVDLADQRYRGYGNTGFEANILRFGVNFRF